MTIALKLPVRTIETLDRIDREIISALQADATLSLAQIADRVGLTQTPCWKRIRKLERGGVITGRVALVDPSKIGIGLIAFLEIGVTEHSAAGRASFADAVAAMPEALEVYRMAGEADYLMKVALPDMRAFDVFCARLSALVELRSVAAQFALERVKQTTAYPVAMVED